MPRQATRNQIFTALLTQLQTAKIPASIGPLVQVSQRPISWDDVLPASQPAMFLVEGPQQADVPGPFGLIRWVMRAYVLVYFRTDPAQDGTVPAQQINDLVDALETAMRAPAGGAQTLGGVVTDAQIEGQIVFNDGTMDRSNQAVVMVPIRILAA